MSRAALLRCAAGLVLCALTLSLFHWEGRFRVADPAVLADAAMAEGFRYWQGSPGFVGSDPEQGGAVALLPGAPPRMTHLAQAVPNPGRYDRYRVSLELRVEGIVAGSKAWQRAGIVLRPFDAAGQRFRYWPYEVALESGTADWHAVGRTVAVPPGTARLWLIVYNAASDGTMWVRGLKVEGLEETATGAALRYGLMALWAALVLSAARALLGVGRRGLRWALLALGAFILAGTLAPQPGLSHVAFAAGREAVRLADAALDALAPAPSPPTTSVPAPRSEPADGVAEPGDAEPGGEAEGPTAAAPEPKDAPSDPPAGHATPEAEPAPGSPGDTPDPVEQVKGPNPLLAWIEGILYEGRPILGLGLGSLVHLSGYLAFAFLSVLALRAPGPAGLAGSLFIAAMATEALQAFTATREVEALDLAFNGAGIAAGLALGFLAKDLLRRLSAARRRGPWASV